MSTVNIRTALQKLGSTSPIVLGAVYTISSSVVTVIDAVIPENAAGSALVAILFTTVLGLLFVTVTWFREDDWLAAGVLMTLIMYAALAAQAFLLILLRGGIGPAAIWTAVTVSGAIIYAILSAPVIGGLVALARKLTRESRRTVA
jgi:hypothetical protein